jgi:hypothetical protein
MSKWHRPRRRRWFWGSLYIAACSIILVPLLAKTIAGVSTTPAKLSMQPRPSGLEAELVAALDPDRCTTSAMAQRELRERLDRLGMSDWTINSLATKSDQCVTWSLAQRTENPRTVTLLPTVSPAVRDGMAAVREETFAGCLTRNEVIDLVTSRLASLGQSDFVVRSDGPFQVPLDREEEVLAHFQAGCWMFSTYGWLDERFTFFVSGKG